MSLVKDVLKAFKQMFAGSGVKTLLSIASGYFYALLLGPGIYGVWQTARIISSYASFINLGMPFYVLKEYPALKGENNFSKANNMARTVVSFTFVSFPVVAIILTGFALSFPNDFEFRKSLIVIAAWLFLTIPTGIGMILNTAENDYKTVGIGESIFGIGSILLVPVIYFYGFNALLLGFLLTTVFQSWYYFKNRPVKYNWYWNTSLLRKMIFASFPIFLVNIAAALFATVDRIVIASMLDFKSVGLYSLSSFISSPISLLVSSFSVVLFTQLNKKYGRSTEPHVIEKHVFIPQKIFSNILPPIIGIGFIALPLFTELFLPKYKEGIVAAQIGIFAIFFYMLAGFSANALFVLGKQKLSAFSFLMAGIIKITGSIIAISLGYGISGVAFFSVIGYFFYDGLMLLFVNKSLGYSLKKYLIQLINKLFCPIILLVTSIIYVVFSPELYIIARISNPWIQLIFGEFLVIIIGIFFFNKGYRSIQSFVNR